jgi:mono/diheme cytochrome c family protein
MGEAVDESLSHLDSADISAMVAYLRTIPSMATHDLPEPRASVAANTFADDGAAAADVRGKAVYEGACAGCHGWTGVSPVLTSATLTGIRSVNDPTATNVAQVIIRGAQRHMADTSTTMPSFGDAYSDAEIAGVANYVTARFGNQGSKLSAANVAKLRAAD